jgi:hypothetical protein
LVIDLMPCEDAHAQERACMPPMLERAQPGELWIAAWQYAQPHSLHRTTSLWPRRHWRRFGADGQHPLAFGVAVLAYNVLALIERAITVRHQLEQNGEILFAKTHIYFWPST